MARPPEKTVPATDPKRQKDAAANETFVREVDDALRQDQLENFFKRFGIPLLVLVVVGLAALGGYLWWEHSQKQSTGERGEQFIVALDELDADNPDNAYKKLQPVIEAKGTASAVSARLLRAGIDMERDQPEDAAKIYAAVAADGKAPQVFRDLASVRYVATRFDDMKPQAVIDRLKPLAVPGNAWFGVAGELVGMAYLEQDKKDLAGPLFANIARDEDLPDTLRGRARQLAGLLGVDAIDDVVGEHGEGSGGPAATGEPAGNAPAAQ